MRKIIVKTIAFSLSLVLAFTGLIYLILATLAPSALASLYFRIDAKELTLKYSEKAYEKSNDIDDLSTLVERSIVFEDGNVVIKRATELINRQDYEEYAKTQSSAYNYYVIGSLCKYLYEGGQTQVAISTALSYTSDYTTVNPIRVMISLCLEKSDDESLLQIQKSLFEREDKNQLVINDISIIEDLLKE